MKAYVIGHYDILDLERYMEYTARVGRTLAIYGGRTLLADHELTVLEGAPRQFVVAVEFDSEAAARKWYNSPEYQEIISLRTESVKGFVVIAREFVRLV